MQNPNDWLMSGGGKHWSFKDVAPGTSYQGIVKSIDQQQQRDFATGVLKTFEDGSPMYQLVVVLHTDERDANVEHDDGTRRDYVKGGDQQKALAQACREGGMPLGLAPGATYARRYDGLGIAQGNLNPPKLFTFRVSPPTPETLRLIGIEAQGHTAPQGQFSPPQQFQQQPAPAPQPAPQAPTPQAVQPVGVADLFG